MFMSCPNPFHCEALIAHVVHRPPVSNTQALFSSHKGTQNEYVTRGLPANSPLERWSTIIVPRASHMTFIVVRKRSLKLEAFTQLGRAFRAFSYLTEANRRQ